MSTAAEILLMIETMGAKLNPMLERLEREQRSYVDSAMVGMYGREVCARRMRKLRRRGKVTIRFSRWTETGKCRYKWVPEAPAWVIA